ncbi:MAG: bifunctional 23S rRNA (guanine(2069)-N(7))-methyltransferase RlmK/23S rRNA (guanine(2445)-N(2))-methyltransferase RlmL [Pseudomonadota bacterium]|nr:bifunctional 23S rRNA (guanine(2069)-N(7))-methyltransferase RlmK/23S rRNA (guanine(2445)-N(2))-methyltransferase RlmL [Pseudomonadota bacterium]
MPQPELLDAFVTAARGLEPLLATELSELGAQDVRERRGGVALRADLESLYRACLWSRTASRVLLPLFVVDAPDPERLYEGALAHDWAALFDVEARLAIEVAGRSPGVTHTHFAALRLKDAIVDQFRARSGRRPSIDTEHADIRLHLHLDRERATISLDLGGGSLHERGYRRDGGQAPLKENLAAALLLRAGWARLAAEGAAFCDPMCGSGTLAIEAAMIAAQQAPGLSRRQWGFSAWLGHRADLWETVRREAVEARRNISLPIHASDSDPRALEAARANARRAGLEPAITWTLGDALQQTAPAATGLLLSNPPYGERLGSENELIKLYSLFGNQLRQGFGGWHAGIFTARPDLAPRLGLRASAIHSFYNGDLPCKLLQFDIPAELPSAEHGSDFANRIRKNLRHLGKWARRNGISAYRLYDADLSEYALAVDLYDCAGEIHLHVQEYLAPKDIDPVRAEQRLRQALAALHSIFELPSERLHFKLRKPQKGSAQYERQSQTQRFFELVEHDCRLSVNFDDYLDTGLFLDHRPLRLRLQRESRDKRVLNLFCYTGSATAHAAVGGASRTLSVDLSKPYLEWAARNLQANGFASTLQTRRGVRSAWNEPHVLLQADCLQWLRDQAADPTSPRFDLIFCDPPTFSNSKRMEEVLDTQRDHVEMIRNAATLLRPGGVLYFSTNRRRFKLDDDALTGLRAEDVTAQTLDEDFKRPPPAHRCWKVRHGAPKN